MNSRKKVIWGIIFILVAVLLLVTQMGLIPELKVGFWTIIWTIVSAAILIEGIVKINFWCIFFGLAFMGIVYAEPLGITAITPWPVLGAALLLSIGCNMIFPQKKNKFVSVDYTGTFDKTEEFKEGKGIEDEEYRMDPDGEYLEFTQVFRSGTKYVNSADLKEVSGECVFGSLDIYFNNVVLAGGNASINIDTVFASLNLYVPADWLIVENGDVVFASVNYKGKAKPNGVNRLTLVGDCVFGTVNVIYI